MRPMSTSKPIHIFKTGTHTAMSGATLAFTEADLAATAAAYDPALHEAPLVVGHPSHDAPAYGWVKSLAFADHGLHAEPDQLDPAFAELVDAGRYKKISASFYHPDSLNNPKPGVYYLRHVGFLGAQPPAIKGLKPVEFADDADCITLEFADMGKLTLGRVLRNLREWLIARHGIEDADQVVPDYVVHDIEDDARRDDEPNDEDAMDGGASPLPAFSETQPGETMPLPTDTASADRIAALEAENAALKQQHLEFAEQKRRDKADADHAAHVAFCEGLIKAGRLLPAQKSVAVAVLDTLSAADSVIEFGEGESKKPLIEAVKADLLSALPKQVEFGEVGAGDGLSNGAIDFADPKALVVAATRYQAEQADLGIVIDDISAIQHVSKGGRS